MSYGADVMHIIKWPMSVVGAVSAVAGGASVKALIPAAAALGVGYYFYGLQIDLPVMELGKEYLAIGGTYFATSYLMESGMLGYDMRYAPGPVMGPGAPVGLPRYAPGPGQGGITGTGGYW